MLTLRGERHARDGTTRTGSSPSATMAGFERRIPVGYEVNEDEVAARFRNGVLTVTLPKSEEAQSQVKRIDIKELMHRRGRRSTRLPRRSPRNHADRWPRSATLRGRLNSAEDRGNSCDGSFFFGGKVFASVM
ncbi:Hsp20/alpha crystallin family protein [Mesorhizobium atlanticum]